MKPETIITFKGFNRHLQQELISLHPELGALLENGTKGKYFAKWDSKPKKSAIKRVWKEQILEALNISDVMEYYGVTFNRRGFAQCPFHREKTASLSVKNNHFKCFGCGQYGNAIDFVVEYFGISFKDAMTKLDNDFNLGITGTALTLEENNRQKEISTRHLELKSEHEKFRQYYIEQTDIFRYLQNAITKYAPMDIEQGPDEWHPVFTYAAQNLNILEYWLDGYIGAYSDIKVYQTYKQEGRIQDWVT